ncbi:leucine-rich repeat and IQ domain-containing protein 4-like [Watersipora subatra]|uniref:leucine-rich repeat and IQ domain-containing protein 4-like n=1 Tax=Watersipora subatra TaxID=2589382 RepID=UPI00355BDEC8
MPENKTCTRVRTPDLVQHLLKAKLASLPSLKELNLSYSKMESAGPVVLESLVSLEKLAMCSCNLSKLPSSFDSLTNLKELDLNLNKLDSDSLVGLEKLVSLEKLRLGSCDLKKLPFRLSSLIKLRNLALWGNPLNPETLDEIVKLDSLEYLDLGSCQLAKLPSGFKRLKKLRQLRLRKNYFEEYPSVLRSLPRHTSIDIRDSDFSKHSTTRESTPSISNTEIEDENDSDLDIMSHDTNPRQLEYIDNNLKALILDGVKHSETGFLAVIEPDDINGAAQLRICVLYFKDRISDELLDLLPKHAHIKGKYVFESLLLRYKGDCYVPF